MYQRVAYFVGNPDDARFDSKLESVFKGFSELPGLIDAKLTYAEDRDANAIDLYASIQLTFSSVDAMSDAMATPQRHELRNHFVAEVLPLFNGEVFHINQRVR